MSMTAAPPETLSAPLLAVAARQRRFRIAQGMLRAAGVCSLIALAAVLVLGGFPHMAAALRWGIALAAWVGMSWTLWHFLRNAFESIDLRKAAGVVETAGASHQELLLSAVEFSSNTDSRQIASGELVDRVIGRAGEVASGIDARQIINLRTILKAAVICIPALLLWGLLWPMMPDTLGLGVRRAIMPWSKEMPLSAMSLTVSPGNLTIGQGGDVVITARDQARIVPQKPLHLQLAMRYADGRRSISSMTPTGPRSYRHTLAEVQASFEYRIVSRRGESRWYSVQVIARPAISRIVIKYVYPSYTHLPPHEVSGADGTITGIAGTQVSVTINATQTLGRPSALDIAASPAGPAEIDALNHVAGTEYQAVFTLAASTHYRIHLVNRHGVVNADDRAWPIMVHTDPPPVVHVISPRGVVRARPDDVIPIRYRATDTYGITSLRVRVKVGGRPSESWPVPLGSAGGRQYSGRWKLNIADQLLAAAELHARTIVYRLVAEDNCLPAHQTGLSGEHEIIIDPNLSMSYQARRDAVLYHRFAQVLNSSIRKLQTARQQITQLQRTPANRHFNAAEMRMANHSQNLIGESARELERAASRMHHGTYRQVASAIRSVTQKHLHSAARNLAMATFDNPRLTQTRSAQLAKAQQGLQAAVQQLQATARALHRRAGRQEITDNVKALAKRQASVSRELSINPTSAGALAKQRQIENQIQRLLKAHPILQRPTQEMAAPKVQHLESELRNIMAAQQRIRRAIDAKLHTQETLQQTETLAAEQQKLNQAVTHFTSGKAEASAVRRMPPISHTAMATALRSLQLHHASAALVAEKQLASQMQRAAERLRQEAGQSQTAAQRQRQADADQSRAQKLEQQAMQAANNTPAERQRLKALAEHIAAAARKQAADGGDHVSRELNRRAESEAQAAARAATENNWPALRKAIQAAGGDLARSAQIEAKAANREPGPQQLSAAAEKLQAFARQERRIAQQTAGVHTEMRVARENSAASMRESSQIASTIQRASTQARQLERQTALGSPQLAAAVAQARRQMRQAEADQRSTNQTLAAHNHPEAAIHQQGALAHIQSALADLQQGMRGTGHVEQEAYNDHIPGEMNPNQVQAANHSTAQGGASASQPHGPTGLSEYQRLMQAAENLKQALAAGHAAGEGNSSAAEAAAGALAQAEEALGSGESGGQNGSVGQGGQAGQAGSQMAAAGGGGMATGTGPSVAGTRGAANSGGIGGAGSGIGADRASGQVPKSVAALGISPAQWVRLGALRQTQLLNTARQAIPPGYRRMVRDYYVKISRLDHGQ